MTVTVSNENQGVPLLVSNMLRLQHVVASHWDMVETILTEEMFDECSTTFFSHKEKKLTVASES